MRIAGRLARPTAIKMTTRLGAVTAWNNLLENSGTSGLDADGVIGTSDDTKIFTSGSATWGNLGTSAGGTTNSRTGFGFLNLYWVHRPESGTINLSVPMQIDAVGSFGLSWDAALGHATLSYVVPVPAAAWLFGSALVGLVGVSRRKSV